jgi:ABC-type thiamin/hydroxymethylpyrimidine transport system permease subunit
LLRESLLIGNVLIYGVLAAEFALPFLLWTRKTRRVGIGLHLGLNYALRLGFFGWTMVAAYLAFLTPAEAGKLLVGTREVLASVGRRLSPRKDAADRATA